MNEIERLEKWAGYLAKCRDRRISRVGKYGLPMLLEFVRAAIANDQAVEALAEAKVNEEFPEIGQDEEEVRDAVANASDHAHRTLEEYERIKNRVYKAGAGEDA